MLDISLLGSIFDKVVNELLYFHPPITTSNSRKIITPIEDPTEILFIKPFLSIFLFHKLKYF